MDGWPADGQPGAQSSTVTASGELQASARVRGRSGEAPGRLSRGRDPPTRPTIYGNVRPSSHVSERARVSKGAYVCRAITSFSSSCAFLARPLQSYAASRPPPPVSRPFSRRLVLAFFPSLSAPPLDMASQSSTTTTYPARAYSQANPIDLTLDDDDEDIHVTERMQKRVCNMSRSFNASCSASATTPSSSYSRQSSSGLSPAMSHSSLAPHGAPSAPSASRTPQPPSYYREPYDIPSPNEVRAAHFQGPSNSAAFFQSRPSYPAPAMNPLDPHPSSHSAPNGSPSGNRLSNGTSGHVIDLTGSPSPPPQTRQLQPQPQPQPPTQMRMQPLQPSLGNLPMDLPPKTPVCIGVLTGMALVLYPISYLYPQELGNQANEWAPVRLQYEHVEGCGAPGSSSETINIRAPSAKSHNGEIIPGETFAVVDKKIATHLGPMLGKGLIRLDAKIQRTNQPVSAHI